MSARAFAARALALLLEQGRALDVALEQAGSALKAELDSRDRAYAQALCFAALRHGRAYQVVIATLVPKKPDGALLALLMISFADLDALETPSFAAVNEAVAAARALQLGYASGLVNAVTRRFSREKGALLNSARQASAQARAGLPSWLETALRANAGAHFDASCASLQRAAPMWLRVHPRAGSAAEFVTRFAAQFAELGCAPVQFDGLPQALQLPSMPVAQIPGFASGELSVQDAAAQLAAELLAPRDGERILDACAAPGGKTAHLLALAPKALVTAVDSDAQRLLRVRETLLRVGAQATLLACDAINLPPNEPAFDAILLDAPCSATGVMRRHPDIAWLRRESDIVKLCQQQRALLDALWQRLKPGGRMLYVTCSILKAENATQMESFLARTPHARCLPFPANLDWFAPPAAPAQAGGVLWRQNFPGQHDMDGFFYALLEKQCA